MASSALKDVIKALNTTFSAQSVSHPLPDVLQQTIELFLNRDVAIDDHESQRLHEELLTLFNSHIATNSDKRGPFISALRLLRPAIKGDKRLEEWWALLIRPTIDAIGHKRDTIEDAREFLLSILVFDDDEDHAGEYARISAQFTKKLMDAYLARTRIPSGEGDVVTPEDEFIAHELEGILVAFGRKKPKELLVAIDEILATKERRLQALSLLSSFVRLQPPHLHLVLETNMIQHLHNCLLIDASSTVVDLALTILIMFLPHITTSLVSDLPKLFLIYARILCWDKYSKDGDDNHDPLDSPESEQGSDAELPRVLHSDSSWDTIGTALDNVQSVSPKANYLFTFLYGLFPLNFMNFIRKPRRYLKMKSYTGAEDLELHQNLIRMRTEPHRACHKLHPNFFNTTPEDELTDNRWLKSDPAELVSECLGLSIVIATVLPNPGPPPTTKLPALPKKSKRTTLRPAPHIPLGDEDVGPNGGPSPIDAKPISWRSTQSTALTAFSTGHTVEPSSIPPPKSSHASLVDALSRSPRNNSPTNKSVHDGDSPIDSRPQTPKRDGRISEPPSPPRLASPVSNAQKLQAFAQTLSRFPVPLPALPPGEAHNTTLLQREVMLLKNEINFERFQRQKYLEQIGHLQRKEIGEITVESDTQNLLNKNRTLRAKLARADERYTQLKKETSTARSQAKKYEDQLNAKLKGYKEEERQWLIDSEALQCELEKAKDDCNELKKLMVESELREHDSRNQLGTLELDLEEVDSLRQMVTELESKLREYELRDLDYQRTKEEHEILRNELETSRLKLNSADSERDRMRRQHDQRIMTLEANLKNAALHMNSTTLPPSVQQMIDSALAVSQNRIAQLRKSYIQLQRKYLELEARNQELEKNILRPASVMSMTKYADDLNSPSSLSPQSLPTSPAGLPKLRPLRRIGHDFDVEPLIVEEEDFVSLSLPPAPSTSSMQNSLSLYPRISTIPLQQQQQQLAVGAISTTPDHEMTMTLEEALMHDFQLNPTETISSPRSLYRTDSTFSFDSQGKESSSGNSAKIMPNSEIRVFGRGGAQNIGKKSKDKESGKKEKSGKTGGFRGLKGIM